MKGSQYSFSQFARHISAVAAVIMVLAGGVSAAPDYSLVGFGAAATGGSGTPVPVSNYTQLKAAAEAGGKIVHVSGTIENGAKGGIINVKSNTSIIGVGTTAFFNGVGINIKGVNNVVVRNVKMTMKGVTFRGTDDVSVYDPDGDEGRPQIKVNDGDCIHIEGNTYDVWIDHSEFYAEDPAVQTNQDLYDGLLDAKSDAHNITVSWNYFHDHHKTSLVGSSDSDTKDRKITWHHNYYYNVKERLPSYRGGTSHMFNNYYKKASGAINSRVGACVYVEKNVFDNVSKTIYSQNSSVIGYAKSIENTFLNGSPAATSAVTTDYNTKCSAFLSPSYAYNQVVTPVADVVTTVTTYAGIGKIDGSVTPSSSRPLSSSNVVVSSSIAPSSSRPLSSSSVATSSSIIPLSSSAVVPQSSSSAVVDVGAVQGENFCIAEGIAETKNAGYLGAAYLNFNGSNGVTAMWALYAQTAEEVTLSVRYANGATVDRPMEILQNGVSALSSISFPATGAWTTWDVVEFKLALDVGRNEIQFRSLGTDGPNIDQISFSNSSLVASCIEPPTRLQRPTAVSKLGLLRTKVYDLLGRKKMSDAR